MYSWQKALSRSAKRVDALGEHGLVHIEDVEKLVQVTDRFKMQVSPHYLSLIDPDDPECPIRKQAIPDLQELQIRSWEMDDPIGDTDHSKTRLIVHRYPRKALLFPTLLCPMYCRYCFRKSKLNGDRLSMVDGLRDAFEYLQDHPDICEVILTGGDPLSLSDRTLHTILKRAWLLPNITRVRIHSRFLVTMPSRFTDELIRCLSVPSPVVLVTHFNHPKEITENTRVIVQRLHEAGVFVGNQTVLLKGVNDDAQTLVSLNEELLQSGIGPYYLHHLDAAPGTHHFRVSLDRGLDIYRRFIQCVDPRWVPRYVLDLPGGLGKVTLNSSACTPGVNHGEWQMISPLTKESVQWSDPSYF